MNGHNQRVLLRLIIIRSYLAEAIPIWLDLALLHIKATYWFIRLLLKPIYWQVKLAKWRLKRSQAKLKRYDSKVDTGQLPKSPSYR